MNKDYLMLRLKDKIKNFLRNTFVYDIVHPYILKKTRKKNKEFFDKHNSYFRAEAEELLRKFSNSLNNAGIEFWLDYGTLLGYYREHDFIKHDLDLDTGAFLKDAEKIRKTLLDNGFILSREFYEVNGTGKEESYNYKHITIDVFYYTKCDEGVTGCSFETFSDFKKQKLNKKLPMTVVKLVNPFKGLKKVEFKGCVVSVPINPEEWLKANYGESFMIPDAHFSYKEEAKNITVYSYEEKQGEGIFYEKV